MRVDLVTSLGVATPLPVDAITSEGNDLFALLLTHDLVADDEPSFGHFRAGGWASLGPAIKVSDGIETFVSPDLMSGMVGEALTDPDSAAKVAATILADVDSYVPDDDLEALLAVAAYADTHRIPLTPQTVARIARVVGGHRQGDRTLVLRLLCATSPDASAADIVETFTHLGAPYSNITRPGAKFDVNHDPTHDQLLRVLDTDGRISRGYPRPPPKRYSVTVA